MKSLEKLLESKGACEEARLWCAGKTPEEAWNTCPRGDWLLWIAQRLGVPEKQWRLASCGCARTVLHLVREGEIRPRVAIETREAWCRGEATLEQVLKASAYAASAAAYASYAAAYAASAAAYASYAADASYAAAFAADAAYAATAIKKNQQQTADVVRSFIKFLDLKGDQTNEHC